IGSPVANRRDQALEGLIGLFVNTLVLRLKCEPEVTFDEFLKQVKAVNLAALDNQDVPFEHLVEIINPPRTLSYSPLIQIVFTLSQAGTTQPQTTNISVEPIKPECLKAKFD
ncbi:non-ribosomal peptide synthetase, partial [Pseudoalteromonas sp. S3178]